jgi:hypothetical protein
MVDASMFEYYRDAWPAKELARQEYGAAATMRAAFREAEDILDEFREFQTEVMGDPKLSAVGKRELRDAWFARKMPALTSRIEKIREEVAKAEEAVTRQAMDKLTATKDDFAVEVRKWLRERSNDVDRGDAVRRLMSKGDLSAVRAVLTVPSYLS